VRRRAVTFFLALLIVTAAAPAAAQAIVSPEEHFGFRMGTDGRLAEAAAIETYFDRVDQASDRVVTLDIGRTTEGHRTPAAIISSPGNIARLDEIRRTNQRFADPRTLAADEARSLAASHKAVIAIGGSIHSSEVGATQAANELLHWLATSSDPSVLTVLENVVVILIPSLNPDGHRLVVDWYERYKTTRFDGGPTPGLYHKYAGHDINRDAFMMNLVENRNLARFFYNEWHPQVFLTMHQMGTNGPR
jgi:murein tripeptide amidase MpaA